MNNIAVIPARGGSKRIPNKNIKLFHGLPIISYAIKNAIESELFESVVVSTDSQETAKIATRYGAIVPWLRSKELSDDFATTTSVMKDAYTKVHALYPKVKNLCCIYPATPLLLQEYLWKGFREIENGSWDFVFSATQVHESPDRYFHIMKNGEVGMLKPEYESSRTQDLPRIYRDAGQFYWGTSESWDSELPIFTSKSSIINLPSEAAVDINTMQDWHYAEYLYERKKEVKIDRPI
jgi:pseudaminic acid cytidylyltransferase